MSSIDRAKRQLRSQGFYELKDSSRWVDVKHRRPWVIFLSSNGQLADLWAFDYRQIDWKHLIPIKSNKPVLEIIESIAEVARVNQVNGRLDGWWHHATSRNQQQRQLRNLLSKHQKREANV